MRLTEVRISGFRSITDVIPLRLQPEITCLIGANEHGKSNLLDAISLMSKGKFDSYDKSLGSYRSTDPKVDYVLLPNTAEKKQLIELVNAALAEAEPQDEAGRKNRKFFQGIRDYLQNGGNTVSITLQSDKMSVIVPGVVVSPYTPTGPIGDFPLVQWARKVFPQVVLFQSQKELADSITLEELQNRANLPFEGLLKLADAWQGRALLFEDSVAGRRRLEQAGKTLTRRLKKIWSQAANHTYRFDQTGGKLHLSIKDPITFDTPSRRSLGFRSFLSFYLALFAETEAISPEGYVLLFDEPGIHLHPQGQKDLLAELRRLARKNQIIYTTHSPFMIDRNEPANTVLVYKGSTKTTKGTRINYKPWGANWTPLSGALGITVADAFYLPDKPLIVEGTSDKLYLASYMRLMQPQTGADLNYLTMIDGDRREDVEGLLRILVGTERKLVVMIDGDPGGQEWIRRLRKFAGDRKNVIEIVDLGVISGLSKPVSIEDVLPPEDWFSSLQKYVAEVLGHDHVIDRREIEQRARSLTMGRAAAEYLVAHGVLQKPSSLSKTSVAHLLVQSTPTVPPRKSALEKLCVELTKILELDR